MGSVVGDLTDGGRQSYAGGAKGEARGRARRRAKEEAFAVLLNLGLGQRVEISENGYREYPDKAVKVLKLIDESQRLGFSLSEIRDSLTEAAPNFPSRAAMVKALRSKLENIDRHVKEIRTRRRQIVKLLEEMGD